MLKIVLKTWNFCHRSAAWYTMSTLVMLWKCRHKVFVFFFLIKLPGKRKGRKLLKWKSEDSINQMKLVLPIDSAVVKTTNLRPRPEYIKTKTGRRYYNSVHGSRWWICLSWTWATFKHHVTYCKNILYKLSWNVKTHSSSLFNSFSLCQFYFSSFSAPLSCRSHLHLLPLTICV